MLQADVCVRCNLAIQEFLEEKMAELNGKCFRGSAIVSDLIRRCELSGTANLQPRCRVTDVDLSEVSSVDHTHWKAPQKGTC